MSELQKIREYLAEKPRDLLLLEIALKSNAPVQDILGLKVKDLKGLEIGDSLHFLSTGDPEEDSFLLTHEIQSAFRYLMSEGVLHDEDYLFKSRKGDKPLSAPSVSRIIRGWREATGITTIKSLPGMRQAWKNELPFGRVDSEDSAFSVENSVLPKIKNKTVQEIVYSELESAIVSGKIAPGKKLVTEEISKMMDVSRIPVREAMGRLEARGFISTRPKWGSVVNELSRENLQEISEIRLQLEPVAADKAVDFVDNQFIGKIESAQREFARVRMTSDTDELLRTNRNFHFMIYTQAFSPILLDLIKQLWDKVSPYYHIMFAQALEISPKIGVSYHEKIVESLTQRNKDGVRQWVEADLIDSTKYIMKLFDQSQLRNRQLLDVAK